MVVAALRRRLFARIAVSHAVRILAAWGFVAGSVAAALRAGAGAPPGPLAMAALAGALAGVAAAVVHASRKVPTAERLLAYVDDRHGLGGLLAASTEIPTAGWASRLPVIPESRAAFVPGRASVVLAASALYVVAALLIPARGSAIPLPGKLDVSAEVEEMTEAVAALEEADVLEPEAALPLETAIEAASRDADPEDPTRTYEVLDRIDREIDRLAAGGAERMMADAEKLGEVEAIVAAASASPDALAGRQGRDLAGALAGLGRELGLDPATLPGGSSGSGRELTPEELARMKRAAGDFRGQLEKSLARLEKAKLVDAKRVSQCKKRGDRAAEGLLAYLKANEREGSCRALVTAHCRRAGRGGVSRGPGHAELTWKEPAPAEGAGFRPEALPAGAPDSIDDAVLTATSLAAPPAPTDGVAEIAASPSTFAEGKAAGSRSEQTVLPRHRAVVARYFESDVTP